MTFILSIGDPHIQTKNIREIDLLVKRVIEVAEKYSVAAIVVLGDTLHTHERLHTTALNKAYDFIRELRSVAPLYVLVGNHDMSNNQQFLTENHWLNGLKEWENVTVVDTVVTAQIGNARCVLVPYVPPGRFVEALDTTDDWRNANCIFAHQEFKGCKMGAIESTEGDAWESTLPQVVSGHIHSRQFVGENVYYPGSPLQHAFGESKNNVMTVVQCENGRITFSDELVRVGNKRIVYVDIEDVKTVKIEPADLEQVRLTIKGSYTAFKAFKKTKQYRDLTRQNVKVVFRPRIEDEPSRAPKEVTFSEVLHGLVESANDPLLLEVYKQVVGVDK